MPIRSDIVIDKEAGAIWKLLTDINYWGRWSPIIDHAVIYGPLRAGTIFKCSSGRWEFDCKIMNVASENSLALSGKTIGLFITMTWQLEKFASATKVTAVIETSGWIAAFFKTRQIIFLDQSLRRWLSSLKIQAERGMTITFRQDEEEEVVERRGTVFTAPFSFLSGLKKRKGHRRTNPGR